MRLSCPLSSSTLTLCGARGRVLLRLARVSNLPTVWSNALLATVAAGAPLDLRFALVCLALSLIYSGGMVLNDAFDVDFDRQNRPERPLPAGDLSLAAAFALAGALLATGGAFLIAGAAAWATFPALAATSGVALVLAVVAYDWHHKGFAGAVGVMAACRFLAMVATGFVLGGGGGLLLAIAAVVGAYTVVLTLAARREAALPSPRFLPQFLPQSFSLSIPLLIAGFSLLDGVILWLLGHPLLMVWALAACGLTLAAQRKVSGS